MVMVILMIMYKIPLVPDMALMYYLTEVFIL